MNYEKLQLINPERILYNQAHNVDNSTVAICEKLITIFEDNILFKNLKHSHFRYALQIYNLRCQNTKTFTIHFAFPFNTIRIHHFFICNTDFYSELNHYYSLKNDYLRLK